MYAIGQIGFGVLVPKKIRNIMDLYDLTDQLDGQYGHNYYSGGAEMSPFFIGIEIDEIDECEDVDLDQLLLKFNNITVNWNDVIKYVVDNIDKIKSEIDIKDYNNLITWINNTKPYKLLCWSTS